MMCSNTLAEALLVVMMGSWWQLNLKSVYGNFGSASGVQLISVQMMLLGLDPSRTQGYLEAS